MAETTLDRRLLNWLQPPDGIVSCTCGAWLWIVLDDGLRICTACRRTIADGTHGAEKQKTP
jgi:hypothetical protein